MAPGFWLMVLVQLGALSVLAFHFSWEGLAIALGWHFLVAGLGITVGYHRCLSHRAVRLARPVEYLFALLGSFALHGDPIRWVTIHRQHHRFTETDGDPHTPLRGFLDAHLGWTGSRFPRMSDEAAQRRYAPDLLRDPVYRAMRGKVLPRVLFMAGVLYALHGTAGLLWGGLVRLFLNGQAIWAVNSIAHGWGWRSYARDDLSTNHYPVALATFGEGFHNNHHALPGSARFGLRWWELDVGWWVIRALEAGGLARDVRVPSREERAAQAGPRSVGELLGIARPEMRGFRPRTVG